MTLDTSTREQLAIALAEAHRNATPIDRLSATHDLTIDDAYDIQSRVLERRVAGGARQVGHKIGLTSAGIQQQLGVDEPDFGRILDDMMVEGSTIDASGLIQPRIEPELALRLASPLEPPVSRLDVVGATAEVFPVLEVIDSRIADWDIGIEDTIADNASSALVVVGDRVTTADTIDPLLESVVLRKNGQLVDHGVGAAVMGNPFDAVAWLANTIDRYDQSLAAGDIVLSGSMTPAADIGPGDVVAATFASLGTVTVRVDPA